jgi:2,2-dialkylglycine decarboxylase (pyruvate)
MILDQRSTDDWMAISKKYMLRRHGSVEDIPPVLTRAEGSRFWDVDGKEYIDFISGRFCATLGHNHPKLVEAIVGACSKMIHANGWVQNDDSIRLAEALGRLLPAELGKVLFKNTGAEANEVALYIAKIYTDNYEIIAPDRGYFGVTAGARAATHAFGRKRHGPGMPGSYSIPAPYAYRCPVRHCNGACDCTCLEIGFEQYDRHSEGYPAAMIVEPIFSNGGVIVPPDDYFTRLRDLAHARGMLIILDEGATGFGRLGTLFAFEELGIVPDILTLGKTMGGGFPISATATGAKIEEVCWKKGFTLGSAHSNDAMPSHVGLAVLETVLAEGLVGEARQKGEYLRSQLARLSEKHELIGEIRGRGLLLGVEFVRNRTTKEPAIQEGVRFGQGCMDRGLIVNMLLYPGLSGVCRLAPPLTISRNDIDRSLQIMDDALTAVSSSRAPRS